MGLSSIEGINIAGIASCVPGKRMDNYDSELFELKEDAEKFIKSTGIRYRHLVEGKVCTSDLCEKAARKLINDLAWPFEEIGALIMVTQTPDYPAPNTAIIMQHRLGFSKMCIAFDIPLGCSGYVYGLYTIASIMSANNIKKGVLLVGDTLSRQASPRDKSAYPLFGDAATATAIEYTSKITHNLKFLLGSDGEGYDAIMVPAGGYREPVTKDSLEYSIIENGIERTRVNTVMVGTDVFTFGISVIPGELKRFLEYFSIDKKNIDFFFFHQANKFMIEKIRKKVGLEEKQIPYSLYEYGNTSSATIPLTISYHFRNDKNEADGKEILLCGFGVGLSWGICSFNTNHLFLPDIIEY